MGIGEARDFSSKGVLGKVVGVVRFLGTCVKSNEVNTQSRDIRSFTSRAAGSSSFVSSVNLRAHQLHHSRLSSRLNCFPWYFE